MPMERYKEVATEIGYPIGVMCPVPATKDMHDEFESPTPLDTDGVIWDMKIIRPAHPVGRKRSITELQKSTLKSKLERISETIRFHRNSLRSLRNC